MKKFLSIYIKKKTNQRYSSLIKAHQLGTIFINNKKQFSLNISPLAMMEINR